MATVYGTNATIQLAGGPPASFIDPGKWGGKVRVMTDVYEAASIASGTVIAAAYLPKDAIVLGMSNICADALGSGVTLSAGISGAAAKFLAAVAFNTAKQRKWFDVVDGLHYKMTAAGWIILTTGGAAATGTIKTEIYYAVE